MLAADWIRNGSGAQRLTILIFRVGQYVEGGGGLAPKLLRPPWLLADRLYLRTLLGTELPARFRCGPGLALPHSGRGIIVHETATLGANSMIFHRVTIGTHKRPRAPQIGRDAYVGTGAVVVGDITIGDGVTIGANSLVNRDVAAGTTVVGVPGR